MEKARMTYIPFSFNILLLGYLNPWWHPFRIFLSLAGAHEGVWWCPEVSFITHSPVYVMNCLADVWTEFRRNMYWTRHRKIRLVEGNAECRHRNSWPVKGLCDSCLSVWGPEPPPPHTLNTCISTVYFFTQGTGGRAGELNKRDG
jgi:hypothetical protein